MELDYILGVKQLPHCQGFGSYSEDTKFACKSCVIEEITSCLWCKRITEQFPNMWKSFTPDRISHITRKLGHEEEEYQPDENI